MSVEGVVEEGLEEGWESSVADAPADDLNESEVPPAIRLAFGSPPLTSAVELLIAPHRPSWPPGARQELEGSEDGDWAERELWVEVLGTGDEEGGGAAAPGTAEESRLGVVIKAEDDSKEDLFEVSLSFSTPASADSSDALA